MTETPARYETDNNPIAILKKKLATPSVESQFKKALADQAEIFTASIVELFSGDNRLKKCDPNAVIMEALKAATLKLPLNRQLGYAWIIAYKNKPQFQIGYKGYIQLAIRTGQYRFINADRIYEGEVLEYDRITGNMTITGEPTSDKAEYYFAYIELVNGFRKGIAWSKEKVMNHAKKYSPSWGYKDSPWKKEFDAMAIKTVLKHLLSHYGIMSIEMIQAFSNDESVEAGFREAQEEMAASDEVIDLDSGECIPPEEPEPEEAPPEEPEPEEAPPEEEAPEENDIDVIKPDFI
jgi:recombination protein RecT